MKKLTLVCVVVSCVCCLVIGFFVGYGYLMYEIKVPLSYSFNAVGVP